MALIGISLVSCSKNVTVETFVAKNSTMEVSFDVSEQHSVSHYNVQASNDGGRSYNTIAVIYSDNKAESHYSARIDVSKFAEQNLLTRIVSVDVDAKTLTSETVAVR